MFMWTRGVESSYFFIHSALLPVLFRYEPKIGVASSSTFSNANEASDEDWTGEGHTATMARTRDGPHIIRGGVGSN